MKEETVDPGPDPDRKGILATLVVVVTLGVALGTVEIAARLSPTLLPGWYRASFPLGGLDLLHPGVLASTPIDGVPLPYRFGGGSDIRGGVPHDLEAMGLVARHDNPDRARYGPIRLHVDRLGFMNPEERTTADLLLVGDSFAVAAGVLTPPGLQARLEKEGGLAVFNVGIPSIGPSREAWLLEEVGLSRSPRAVVWLFFGGNDLTDEAALQQHELSGVRTYADLFPDSAEPGSFAIDVLGRWLTPRRDPTRPEPVPGQVFQAAVGAQPLWFYPAHLRELTHESEAILEGVGWRRTARALSRVSRLLRERRIPLLVVYVPSKAQVYLPFVDADPPLTHRMASFDQGRPLPTSPEAFWSAALRNRGSLERVLSDHCRDGGIAFVSLTGRLEDVAAGGRLAYLAADTHWNEIGQATAIAPVLAWLEGLGAAGDPRTGAKGPSR